MPPLPVKTSGTITYHYSIEYTKVTFTGCKRQSHCMDCVHCFLHHRMYIHIIFQMVQTYTEILLRCLVKA